MSLLSTRLLVSDGEVFTDRLNTRTLVHRVFARPDDREGVALAVVPLVSEVLRQLRLVRLHPQDVAPVAQGQQRRRSPRPSSYRSFPAARIIGFGVGFAYSSQLRRDRRRLREDAGWASPKTRSTIGFPWVREAYCLPIIGEHPTLTPPNDQLVR